MYVILLIITAVATSVIIDRITARRWNNPFKVIYFTGFPGKGKSLMMTKEHYKHNKKGWECFSDDTSITVPGVTIYDVFRDLKEGRRLPNGKKGYPAWHDAKNITYSEIMALVKAGDMEKLADLQNQGIIGPINEENRRLFYTIDECGIVWNNRDFKAAFTPETLKFFKEHRHRNVKMIVGSQSWEDIDKKIRQLSQEYYIIDRGFFKNFVVGKKVLNIMDIINASGDGEDGNSSGGKIIVAYKYDIFIFWKYARIGKWVHKFDSFR